MLAFFLVGAVTAGLERPAEAKAKKKVVRRVKVRKAKKVSRTVRKKLPRARVVTKKTAPSPSRSGSVTQSYLLEEGVGGDEAENLISGLKSVGADDVAVDSGTNTITVTFNTSRLTSVGVVRKLKNLGYTAKRAY